MTNFSDIIKNRFLEEFSAISVSDALVAIALAFALSLFIVFVYRATYSGVSYNKNFANCLIMLSMVTAVVILVISSNVVLSLGMVGALSIVRFRNAVKDPADLMHLFWSISMGIVVGAGLYELAIFGSLGITVLAFGLDLLPALRLPCMLVVSGSSAEAEAEIMACIRKFSRKFRVRSRNISRKGAEWIVELQIKQESALLQELSGIGGVESVHIMTHDGEVRF